MKKNLFLMLVVAMLSASNLFAQDDTMHTLVKLSAPKYIGLYVAPEYQYGQAAGVFNSYVGSSAMLIMNKKMAIGVTGFTNTQENFAPAKVSPLLLRSSFGGLKLEYTPRPNSAVHVTFPLVVGFGVAQLDSVSYTSIKNPTIDSLDKEHGGGKGNHYNNGNDFGGKNSNRGISNDYFIIQPGIQLEANIFRAVKLFGGVNYRIAFPTETVTAPLANSTLSGLSANIGLKVGLFDFSTTKKRNLNLRFWKKKS